MVEGEPTPTSRTCTTTQEPPPPNKWVLKIFIDEWIFDTGSLHITLNSQSACFCFPTAGLKEWVTKSNLKVFIFLKNKN